VTRVGVATGVAVLALATRASAQLEAAAPEKIAIADWQLVPILETRVRGEYTYDLDGQGRGFLVERARLGVDVERGAVKARVLLQDARMWNVEGGLDPVRQLSPLAQTGAYEAWAEGHTASAVPSFVRVGRQRVTWGEGRLLGSADWSPTGRSLDAVRGRLSVGDGAFELLAASLTDSSGGSLLAAYGQLFGARAEWALQPLLAGELYGLARLAQVNPPAPLAVDGSVRGETYTAALRAHGDNYVWAWGVEGAYQFGRAEDLDEDRAAWAAAGHVAHTFERVALLPSARLGFAYASGDRPGSTYRGFDPLLPDVHAWHGAMDLFSWSNEVEASVRAGIVPWTDAAASVEYRYVRLAEPSGAWHTAYLVTIGSPVGTNKEADLGHEIDGVLSWSPWVPLELTVGYSVLVLGNGARAILAGGPQPTPGASHFAYLQATLRMF
jgi:alginate export protein